MRRIIGPDPIRAAYDILLGLLQIIMGLALWYRPGASSTNYLAGFLHMSPNLMALMFITIGLTCILWRPKPLITWMLNIPFMLTLFLTLYFIVITPDRALWAAVAYVFQILTITLTYLYFEARRLNEP